MLSMARSTRRGSRAFLRAWPHLRSSGLNVAAAPSCSKRRLFSALRESATTLYPMAAASCTAATPTPPDAPVTNTTADGGSGPHIVSA